MRRHPVVAAAAVAALVPQLWFRPGRFIATGEVGFPVRDLEGITAAWGTELTATGSTSTPSAMLLERGLTGLVELLGGSAELAQRLWFTLVVAVCAASVAWLTAAVVRRRSAIFVAGMAAVLNPFVLVTVPDMVPLIAVAAVASIVGIAARLAVGRHVPSLAALAVATWSAQLVREPRLLTLVVAVAAVSFLALAFSEPSPALARVVGALVAGSLFWAVPLIVHRLTGSPGIHAGFVDPAADDWLEQQVTPAHVVTLVASPQWGDASVAPVTERLAELPWSVLGWAMPAAVALALAFSWRRALAKLLAAATATVIVATLVRPEFVDRAGVLLVVLYATALALGVDDGHQRWPVRRERPEDAQTLPVLMVLFVPAIVFVNPLLTGAVIPGARPTLPPARVELPSSWPEAAGTIDALPSFGASLVVPISDAEQRGTTWGYYGVDDLLPRLSRRPAQVLLPGADDEPDGTSPALMREAESALVNGDGASLAGTMRALGARYLVVRTDTTTAYGTDHDFRDGAQLVAAAERIGLQRVATSAQAVVFEIPAADRFGVATEQVTIFFAGEDNPAEEMAVAAASIDRTTVLTDAGDAGTAWVPDPGESGLAVSLPAGSYEARVVARGPALWRATVSDRVVELVPADRAEIDGESVLDSTPLVVAANRDPVALLVANDPEPAAAPLLVPLAGSAEVQLVAGGTVTPLTAAPSIVSLAGAAPMRCDSSDGLPQGRVQTVDATSTSDGVELEAAQGSACIGVPVRTAEGSGPQRWRLSARYTSSQPGTARTCLWSAAQERCLAGSRIVSESTAGAIDTLVDADGDLGDVTLVLVADHGDAIADPPVTVEFDGVRLEPLREGVPVTVPSPAAATPSVTSVDDGRPVVLGAGNDVGEMLGELTAGCPDDAGSTADANLTPLEDEPPPAYELRADADRTTCVAAPVGAAPGVRDVVLTFDYRSDASNAARVEVIDSRSGAVVATDLLPATTFWASATLHYQLPQATADESLQLVLSAVGPAAGDAVVAYRQVRMTTAVPFAFAVLPVADASRPTAADVRSLDDRFVAVRADGDVVVTFQQAYAERWELVGLPDGATAEHIGVNGWANGWVVRGLDGRGVVLEVRYRDDPLVSLAVWSILWVWLVGLLCTDWRRLVRH